MLQPQVLLLGASGRLGQIYWREAALDPTQGLLCQTRSPWPDAPGNVVFDPLAGEAPDALKADCVLSLAGVVPGPDADLAANTSLGLGALRLAHGMGARHVFLASSAAVYGAGPFREDAMAAPLSDYGRAKLDMEQAALAWCQGTAQAPGLTLLRIGNVAGVDAFLGPGPRHVTLDCGADDAVMRRSFIGPGRFAHMMRVLVQMAIAGAKLPTHLNIALSPAIAIPDLFDAAGWSYQSQINPDLTVPQTDLDTSRLAALGFEPQKGATAADIIADLKAYQDAHATDLHDLFARKTV